MRDDKTLTIAASNEAVIVHPDRLQVTVAGAPSLNVRYSEVGLRESQTVGVGGGT